MVPRSSKLVCASCGSERVVTENVNQTFPYGTGDERVMLSAVVPVRICQDCAQEFTDAEAAQMRHEAVCRHLGVMTPREIVSLRESLGYTQQQLADLTGIGVASIARWENGYNIQSSAYDNLLRLVKYEDNRRRLGAKQKSIDHPATAAAAIVASKRKFPSLSDADIATGRAAAPRFRPMLGDRRVH